MIQQLLKAIGLSRSPASVVAEFVAGDLVSVAADDDLYAPAKVLVADSRGIHLKLYVQRFAQRPTLENIGEPTVAPYGPEYDNPLSMGHLPLSHASFQTWQPVLISRGAFVVEDELEGYRVWQEAEGGYF